MTTKTRLYFLLAATLLASCGAPSKDILDAKRVEQAEAEAERETEIQRIEYELKSIEMQIIKDLIRLEKIKKIESI